MSKLPPIPKSRTKTDLVELLEIDLYTYALMLEETEVVYQELMSDKKHLTWSCERTQPPFTWGDLQEQSKHEAMISLVRSSSPKTKPVWNRAGFAPNCPNWIACWFLYYRCRMSCSRIGYVTAKSLHRRSHRYHQSMTLAPIEQPISSCSPHDPDQEKENRVPGYFDPVRDAIMNG